MKTWNFTVEPFLALMYKCIDVMVELSKCGCGVRVVCKICWALLYKGFTYDRFHIVDLIFEHLGSSHGKQIPPLSFKKLSLDSSDVRAIADNYPQFILLTCSFDGKIDANNWLDVRRRKIHYDDLVKDVLFDKEYECPICGGIFDTFPVFDMFLDHFTTCFNLIMNLFA